MIGRFTRNDSSRGRSAVRNGSTTVPRGGSLSAPLLPRPLLIERAKSASTAANLRRTRAWWWPLRRSTTEKLYEPIASTAGCPAVDDLSERVVQQIPIGQGGPETDFETTVLMSPAGADASPASDFASSSAAPTGAVNLYQAATVSMPQGESVDLLHATTPQTAQRLSLQLEDVKDATFSSLFEETAAALSADRVPLQESVVSEARVSLASCSEYSSNDSEVVRPLVSVVVAPTPSMSSYTAIHPNFQAFSGCRALFQKKPTPTDCGKESATKSTEEVTHHSSNATMEVKTVCEPEKDDCISLD